MPLSLIGQLRHFISQFEPQKYEREDSSKRPKSENLVEWVDLSDYNMRREFSHAYGEAISLIKQLKNSNDSLNRSVGLEKTSTILLKLQSEKQRIDEITAKIMSLLEQMEKSYLDPDSARKVGTARQQFRIQRDRRQQLLKCASIKQMQPQGKESPIKGDIPNFNKEAIRSEKMSPPKNKAKINEQIVFSQTAVSSLQHEEEIDFQLQRKIMQERNKEITIVSKAMLNVQNILQETSQLTYQQGQKLQIIGEDLFKTYRNVNEARQELIQANQRQRRGRRKYFYFSAMLLIMFAVGVIVFLA